MNEWTCSDLKCIRKPTWGRLSLTHLPIQPLSRLKSLNGPRVRVISPVGKEKVYGGKDLLKMLSSPLSGVIGNNSAKVNTLTRCDRHTTAVDCYAEDIVWSIVALKCRLHYTAVICWVLRCLRQPSRSVENNCVCFQVLCGVVIVATVEYSNPCIPYFQSH